MFSPRDVYLEDYSSLDAGLFITTSVFSIKLRLKQTEKLHSKVSSSRELLNMLLLDVCEQLIRTV